MCCRTEAVVLLLLCVTLAAWSVPLQNKPGVEWWSLTTGEKCQLLTGYIFGVYAAQDALKGTPGYDTVYAMVPWYWPPLDLVAVADQYFTDPDHMLATLWEGLVDIAGGLNERSFTEKGREQSSTVEVPPPSDI